MRHFTLSSHWRLRWYVTIDGRIILSIAMNGSYSGMVPTPCTLRTWGTQAIDYSWANLMSYHTAQTSSTTIQDVDVILIWRLYFPRVEQLMSVWPSWQVLQLRTVKSRVRLSGSIIFRLRLNTCICIYIPRSLSRSLSPTHIHSFASAW